MLTGALKRLSNRQIIIAVLLFSASIPVMAQSGNSAAVDAPESVCTGEEFAVDWVGPGAATDLITFSPPNYAPAEFLQSRQTSEGNPSNFRAPYQEGLYEVRYVAGEPQSVQADDEILVAACGSSSSSDEEDEGGPALVVSGIQTDYAEQINTGAFTKEQICNAGDVYASTLGQIVDQIELSMTEAGSPITLGMIEGLPGAPSRADVANDLRNARAEFCGPDAPPNAYPFVITYAHCRMAMVTPAHAMDIHLPPGTGNGTMSIADHERQEVMLMTLQRNLEAVAEQVGSGWSSMVDMNPTGSVDEHIGYGTREYNYEYGGGLGGGGGALQTLGSMVSVTNSGTAWISSEVPGIDIVRSFYENLTREMQVGQGATSFFSGLISNIVGMLREGIPLEIDSTVRSKIMGRTSISGRSKAVITGVRVLEFKPGWCSRSLMPAGYAVTDIDQQISNATTQLPDGGSAESAELAEAMQQMNEAMEQMTPQERQMLEQFGLGGMTGAGAAAAAPGSSTPPATAGTGISSADLTTGDLTESVQKHLAALGYDTGVTDGGESWKTAAAISEFQAKKGITVDGKASPQLLGILSAEVDGGN